MTKQEAIEAAVRGILADPEQTIRVVVAAIVAQDELDRDHPAFDTLWNATKQKEAVR